MNKETSPRKKSTYFLSIAMVSIVSLLLLIFGVGYHTFHTSQDDFNLYHSLMAEANPILNHQTEKPSYTATQQQHQVRKDIYFSKGLERLHFLLVSRNASVIFDHQSGKTDLKEELSDVNFFAQQELFYADSATGNNLPKDDPQASPWQKIYHGTADKAFFSYKDWTFRADKTRIVEYDIPGHEIFVETEERPFSQLLMSLEAQKSSYDGKELSLEDKVRLEHPLGSMFAEKVVISPALKSKALFESVVLERDVILSLKDQGNLFCQKALFDYGSMKGQFYGNNTENPFVLYSSQSIAGRSPVVFKSRSMDLLLIQDPIETNKLCVTSLTGLGEVNLDYYGELFFTADRAIYNRDLEGQNALSYHKLPGKIRLDTTEANKQCYVFNQNGDSLVGSTIEIDTNQRKVHFTDAIGLFTHAINSPKPLDVILDPLKASATTPAPSTLQVQAADLNWDLSRDLLSLKGEVEVDHSVMGNFQSDQELRVFYTGIKGQRNLRAIESEGHIVLRRDDPLKKQSHWLICDGKMLVNHEAMTVFFQSSEDTAGKVNQDKQVFFYDSLGEIQADKITISYQEVAGKFAATKVKLEGNVFMIDHKDEENAIETERTFVHYALADFVEYTLSDKEMHLYSKDGKRVLFYDKINQLNMSAPALKVKRDDQTKKESVKGIGDVRFHFLDSELEQLRKYSAFDF